MKDPIYCAWVRFNGGPWDEVHTADGQRVQGMDREYVEFWLRGCNWKRAGVETVVLEAGERPDRLQANHRKGHS